MKHVLKPLRHEGSGTHLYSNAICSPINGIPPTDVTPTYLLFKVDPNDCTLAGVRVQYNNPLRGNGNTQSSTG